MTSLYVTSKPASASSVSMASGVPNGSFGARHAGGNASGTNRPMLLHRRLEMGIVAGERREPDPPSRAQQRGMAEGVPMRARRGRTAPGPRERCRTTRTRIRRLGVTDRHLHRGEAPLADIVAEPLHHRRRDVDGAHLAVGADGLRGREGDGPAPGTQVEHRLAGPEPTECDEVATHRCEEVDTELVVGVGGAIEHVRSRPACARHSCQIPGRGRPPPWRDRPRWSSART